MRFSFLKWIQRFFRPQRPTIIRRPGRTSFRARLALESLEERTTPSAPQALALQPLLFPNSGANYSNSNAAGDFTAMGGKTYFLTGDTTSPGKDDMLWVTDGTSTGTSLVKDLGSAGILSSLFTNGSELFFFANNQVWQSDGTAANTNLMAGNMTNPTP
jgi:ELWxxDGT repeat protein